MIGLYGTDACHHRSDKLGAHRPFPTGFGQSAFWKYDLALPSRLHTGRHLRHVSLKPLRTSHRNGIRADVRTHGKRAAAKIIAAAPLM